LVNNQSNLGFYLAAKNNRQKAKKTKTNQRNKESKREILKSEPFFHDLSSIKVIY